MRRLARSLLLTSLIGSAGVAFAALDTREATQAKTTPKKSVTLGPTFDIVEPDMLAEIKSHGADAQMRMAQQAKRPIESYSGFRSVQLPIAKATQTRIFDPTYTLPQDIFDGQGKVMFAKGTKVNVYDKITMPGRFIVIGPYESHYEWLKSVAKPSDADIVLLASGNVAEVRRDRHLKVYLLDQRGVERLGLQVVPSIVQQSGRMLKVSEFSLDESGKPKPEQAGASPAKEDRHGDRG